MKKTIFIAISVILVLAMVIPFINIQSNDGEEAEKTIEENVLEAQDRGAFALPVEQLVPERCDIDSPYKENWQTVSCETFDSGTELWTGNDAGLVIEIRDGKYVFDSSKSSPQINDIGYSFPVLVGIAPDLMFSVSGEMDCLEGNCAWGFFVRSTTESIVYVFLLHDDGSYSLTGLSPEETDQNLGNIQAAANSIIKRDSENTIVAITEGAQMMFFVNDILIATHEAYNASNPSYGIMAWGSPGTKGITRLDNVLARVD